MLEFLRKHQGTMWIVITVVVIISFVFFGSVPTGGGRQGPEDTAFTIYGQKYSYADLDRFQRLHRLASMLQLGVGERQTPFADVLTYISQQFQFAQEAFQPDFAFNLIILREQLVKNGIHVSDTAARDAFRTLPFLQTPEGKFDASRAEFIQTELQNQLGALGLRQSDLFDLLRDWVGLQKLLAMVAGNFVADNHLTNQIYTSTFHTIKAATIPFAIEDYKKDIKVTDEEISRYFDERKDEYKTAEKRAISYVLFSTPDTEKLSPEETAKTKADFATKVNDFAVAVIAPKADFAAEAKKAAIEVLTTPAFSQDAPPEALKEASSLVTEVFRNDPATHPVSDPVQDAKGNYYLFKITEVQAPKPQELKDVTETIRAALTTQKATEISTQKTNEARKKMEELIKSGKDFASAAKEAGVTPQTLPEFSLANPPTDLSNGAQIAREASSTPAGSFTKPLTTPNGLLLVFVLHKELRKSEEAAQTKQRIQQSIAQSSQINIFRAWFEHQRDKAGLEATPYFQSFLNR